jgi:drug/metabolite transporter (DMT)-like permease
MNNNKQNMNRGYGIALFSALILSTTAIFVRYLTQTFSLPPLILAFWREFLVALTLLIVFLIAFRHLLKVRKSDLPILLLYGLTLAVFNALWTIAVAMNGAAISTVLVYTSTAFTAVLGRWLFKEQLGLIKIIAVLLCLGGCVLVSGALDRSAWISNGLGILTGILSGLSYAVYSLIGRAMGKRGINPWTTLLYIFGIAALILFTLNLCFGKFLPGAAQQVKDFLWLGDSLKGWGILFLLAAGPTVVGFGMLNISLSRLPASVANLILSLEPAFTTIIAYFFLSERLIGLQIIGSLMIMAGVVFVRLEEGRISKKSCQRQAQLSVFHPINKRGSL